MPATVAFGRGASIRSALIVDDHPLYCDALAMMMQSAFNMKRVRKANSLADALHQLRVPFAPDLVLLDLNLPDVSGLSGFLKIKERAPDTPVIVISASTSVAVIRCVMDAGAAGFIPKDVAQKTFRAALKDVWEGRTYVPAGYDADQQVVRADPSITDISRKVADLSRQQSRILGLICKGKPNKVIAFELDLAEATVKAHVTAVLRRLGVRNRTQAALMIREVAIRQQLR